MHPLDAGHLMTIGYDADDLRDLSHDVANVALQGN
jgi:hypothetical protein